MQARQAKGPLQSLLSLLASMPFAIAILAFVAVASIIGTILQQNESIPNYVVHFGPFWAHFFLDLGLDGIYRSHWFLLLLAFLVLSTALCLARNGPKLVREIGSKPDPRLFQVVYWPHRYTFTVSASAMETQALLMNFLEKKGFWTITREGEKDFGIAAKSKGLTRLGYLATHLAIVLICLGGLIDANPILKVFEILGRNAPSPSAAIEATAVPRQSLLDESNPAFRASILLPEGSTTQYAFINRGNGVYVQELPFKIKLINFYTEFYQTGQPKKFASQIEIIDQERDLRLVKNISVNEPATYRGITIYQASFGDGGTKLEVLAWPLLDSSLQPLAIKGAINTMTPLQTGTIEWQNFRLYNVENVSSDPKHKKWQNLGPAIVYRWRKPTGEAIEYFNYMAPIEIEGRWYAVSGVRKAPNEPYVYWRLPLDGAHKVNTFMQIKASWQDSVLRQRIAAEVAEQSVQDDETQAVLSQSLASLMDEVMRHGLFPTLDAILAKVPEEEKEKLAAAYLKLLWQAVSVAISENHPQEAQDPRFVEDSLYALGQLSLYGAPFYLQLVRFEHIEASGIQLTRAPGTFMVYLGSFFLALGVFAQFFFKENTILVNFGAHQAIIGMAYDDKSLLLEIERLFGGLSWLTQNTS